MDVRQLKNMKYINISILLFIQLVVYIFMIFYFDGTGDSGDSVMHYLFAKYSFQHTELFFDHWAKPVYVLLASPFAQFGFYGIKVFNALVMLLTTLFTFRTIQKLNIKNSLIGAIILVFSPLVFVLTFSGLTEPLFALFLIISIYLILSNKYFASCLLVSFLPFIRSEGIIILGVFGLYLLLKGKWKLIPILLFGHIAYSIAGFHVYNDILWIFTKIPYAELDSNYGRGNLLHFVEQMNYVVGVPIYLLFWIGIFAIIVKSIKKKISTDFFILIFFIFFTFLLAHTLFWYLGIFNSMGLKRVFIGVVPLSSIIALFGFNYLTGFLQNKVKLKLLIQSFFVAYIVVFPFTSNPAAINWKTEFTLSEDQKLADQISPIIAKHKTSTNRYFYAHPYLSISLKIDPFDNTKRMDLYKGYMNHIHTGDIIIWDNWFAFVESGISKEDLDQNKELINLYNFSASRNGKEVSYSVYEYK